MAKFKFAVVGGGLAGLGCAMKLAESGYDVDLFSIVPVRRSHSVCAQGGINAAKNLKGEGDSCDVHFDDTVYGGDFLANQPPVKSMCYAAPKIIDLFDRMGVMFNRTPEGNLDFRRFGGTLHHRTAFAGATTGQQLIYALDEQVRRWEAEGRVKKFEGYEFTGIIKDSKGNCVGMTALDLREMKVHAFKYDAICMAVGGPGLIFGKTTNSVINTGAAASRCYQQGAWYANPEFIQVHPTAIPGEDKCRLMSESARGEGGRVWVYKDGKPWYFLEEMFPAYGNLVPRDIATRVIYDVCVNQGLGVDGKLQVYLDLSHLPADFLDRKLGGIMEIYEKFAGEDPRRKPMKVFPAVHYSMGGLWCDYERDADGFMVEGSPRNHQTNIPGLWAAGECEYQYHGANRLGANALLSCTFAGMQSAPSMANYAKNASREDVPQSVLDEAAKKEQAVYDALAKREGKENVHLLSDELGETMNRNCTIVRYNGKLKESDDKVLELMERYANVGVTDRGMFANQTLAFTRQFMDMLILARPILAGAIARDESRGAHYKPDFPERNDSDFLKTTIAEFTPDGPKLSWQDVDVSLIKPRLRSYVKASEGVKGTKVGG
ncbi:MAG: succinate dehydrogenase flavoprotein subunit [bacterium]|jgi:succinate dehydrogenase / fumarate reductase flavoprotein subunit